MKFTFVGHTNFADIFNYGGAVSMVFPIDVIDFECAYCLRESPAEEQTNFRARAKPPVCVRCDESLCNSCVKCCELNEFSNKKRSNFHSTKVEKILVRTTSDS